MIKLSKKFEGKIIKKTSDYIDRVADIIRFSENYKMGNEINKLNNDVCTYLYFLTKILDIIDLYIISGYSYDYEREYLYEAYTYLALERKKLL